MGIGATNKFEHLYHLTFTMSPSKDTSGLLKCANAAKPATPAQSATLPSWFSTCMSSLISLQLK